MHKLIITFLGKLFHNLRNSSLKKILLFYLIPIIVTLGAVEIYLNYQRTVSAIDTAYDRSLLGAIRAIEGNISTIGGGIAFELPYRYLEFFGYSTNSEIYYRVSTDDGLVDNGNYDLPPPENNIKINTPHFQDVYYNNKLVRMVTVVREIAPNPFFSEFQNSRRIFIQLAEDKASRYELTENLIIGLITREFLIQSLTIIFSLFIINYALNKLSKIKTIVDKHTKDNYPPINENEVPIEVRPLVRAINLHIHRQELFLDNQRKFVDAATHQLRTRLSALATQASFIKRANNIDTVKEGILAVEEEIKDTKEIANHILALARADSQQMNLQEVEINQFIKNITQKYWKIANENGIKLEFEGEDSIINILLDKVLFTEAINNLLDNCMKYVPPGGNVIVRSGKSSKIFVEIEDDGIGLHPEEFAKLGERFPQIINQQNHQKNRKSHGLGLAFVKTVVQRLKGDISFFSGKNDKGLLVKIEF